MIHLNGNVLCAIDTETTGLDPEKNEIVQICVLPLDWNIRKDPNRTPFYMEMRPENLEYIEPRAMAVNGLDLTYLRTQCLPSYRVTEIFWNWFEALNLAPNKGIVPLGKNWSFDSKFIKAWLGPKTYDLVFKDKLVRDLQTAVHFVNDLYDFKGRDIPFPKFTLTGIATRLEVNKEGAHDALQDCLMTAECYRRLMAML